MRLKWVGLLVSLVLLLSTTTAHAQVDIVPKPRTVVSGQGYFVLKGGVRIAAPGDARAQQIAQFLREAIHKQTGISPVMAKPTARSRITLRIDSAIKGHEAYRLDVTPTRVTIAAADDRGLFWGVQSLRQLLPAQHQRHVRIASVHIKDAPRYAWRGVMLDTARHFFPVDFIKKQIDLMSYYKFNVFHWHLTDDQGWRIQIKRYPKLTGIGAWRTKKNGKRYGGFYTQQQIRAVVAYARARNVTVVPEIEMPGHISAAIAAYPQLSCGEKSISVPTGWGVFRNVGCVGKDSTFTFLDHVLDEVVALFPSPYVHIGGDEVPTGVWSNCKSCQRRARQHGLHGEPGLHSYFVRRIQTYLASKGKTMIGWDEIMEGGMDSKAIVEVWRGPGEAKKALANGNRIIVASPFYLDTPINDMTLQDLYRNDPFDNPLYTSHPKRVLGGEAPLWSERATPLNGEAKLYPRLLAISEHVWNPAAHNYANFLQRVHEQEKTLASQHVAYGPANKDIVDYRPSFNATYKRWRIRAERGFADMRLHYTTDGSQPTATSPSFGDVLDLYSPATVTVAPFRGKVQYQASKTFRLVENKALGKPLTYATSPAPQYFGGPEQLVNGILGSTNFHDGAWAGWEAANMDAVIDMQHPTSVHSIDAHFLQVPGSWIFLPRSVSFEISNDDNHWTTLQTVPLAAKPRAAHTLIRDVAFTAKAPVTARYIRVVATRIGKPVNGVKPWIFSDEIIVQ